MGIFKNITKSLKKAAPLIGSAIGMYFGGPLGASIGSGIGSLAAGRSAEEALQNAALAGATTYAMGGKDFGKGFDFSTSGSPFASPSTTSAITGNPVTSVKAADTGGIGSFLKDMLPESTAGKIALGSAGLGLLGALGGEEKEEERKMPDYPKGKTRLGYGRIGNKQYNLDDEEDRKRYFEDNRNRGIFANAVGEIAEKEGHHPDISIGWGYCLVMVHTHAIEGLSVNDFILASKIDLIKS